MKDTNEDQGGDQDTNTQQVASGLFSDSSGNSKKLVWVALAIAILAVVGYLKTR